MECFNDPPLRSSLYYDLFLLTLISARCIKKLKGPYMAPCQRLVLTYPVPPPLLLCRFFFRSRTKEYATSSMSPSSALAVATTRWASPGTTCRGRSAQLHALEVWTHSFLPIQYAVPKRNLIPLVSDADLSKRINGPKKTGHAHLKGINWIYCGQVGTPGWPIPAWLVAQILPHPDCHCVLGQDAEL